MGRIGIRDGLAMTGGEDMSKSARERPWLMRTYSGHSSAAASNALYRTNMARGQTGLSIAFDLPTQIGYDADHPLARGEVGRVGVPISHLGDMRTLFDGIPLARMNCAMTINATAPWLLALLVALAQEQDVAPEQLAGTVQNDIVKEYLSRGTYIFPPEASLGMSRDLIIWCARHMPRFNPINICSYHLQEAGATVEEELAFALANAIDMLERVRAALPAAEAECFAAIAGRVSFFVNSGVRFVTEMCKMRAFAELWDEILRDRFGIREPRYRRFRYGVQVNSLGLTEAQAENNVHRILVSALGVLLSRRARARALQLPAWNEALGLPREWDQQWSLRMQQILAYETDLLDYPDLFDGSPVVADKVASLKKTAREEIAAIEAMGGVAPAIESGYLKRRLVASQSARLAAIADGSEIVVGVNRWTESAASPLHADGAPVLMPDPEAEAAQIARLNAWRAARDEAAVARALATLRRDAAEGREIMSASIAAAHAGVTTGEWAACLRAVHGEYRAPTGLSAGAGSNSGARDVPDALRERIEALAGRLGRKPRILIGKPGLDGHSNGAEQIATAARDCGYEAIYEGIRLTPAEIIDAARARKVDAIGLSVLSGAHLALAREALALMTEAGMADVPLVLGGIVPEGDRKALTEDGIAAIFTPRDYRPFEILSRLTALIEERTERVKPPCKPKIPSEAEKL
ncbi:MAG: protein meaA [Rhodothalassiaceae bacterium]